MFSSKTFFSAGSGLMILISAACFNFGCSTMRNSDPARTSREQLLLSTAADRALKTADLEIFKERKVFVDQTYFDSYDSKYALGTVRDALSRAGALLVATAAASDIIVEARSGALSTDGGITLFGLPAMGAPIPLAGSVQIPEIAFYKSEKDHSTAKIALLAYATRSGEHVYSSGSLVGHAYENYYHCLGLIFLDYTDLPEKQKDEKHQEKYESWTADYNEAALDSITNAPVAATNAPVNVTKVTVTVTNAPAAVTNIPAAGTNSVSK